MRKALSLILVLALSGVFLAGCGSKEEAPAADPAKAGSSGADVKGAGQVGGASSAADSDKGRG